MATRTGRLSKPDKQGKYARQLGWKFNAGNKRVQHKFRLGANKREAERRDDLLRRIWETIEEETEAAIRSTGAASANEFLVNGDRVETTAFEPGQAKEPLWDEDSLTVAKQVAGGDPIVLFPLDSESDEGYATRVQRIQDRFAFLRMAPGDAQKFSKGKGEQAARFSDCIVWAPSPGQKKADDELFARLRPTETREPSTIFSEYQPTHSQLGRPREDGRTLHEAFDGFVEWIKKHKIDPETQELTDYAYTEIGQFETLKYRHEDVPLSTIGYEEIEDMYRFWKNRPPKRTTNGDGDRISPESIKHYVGGLYRMFKWLHRSRDFAWRKPEDFDSIDRKTPRVAKQVKSQIQTETVDTFNIEELKLLNRYATPFERFLVLLGLNCGFGPKEVATFSLGEVYLHQALTQQEQEKFDFPSTSKDSFASLVRNKSVIVGKFLLFKQTVQMLEWAMARRLTQPNPTPDAPLWLTDEGHPLDKRSPSGNPSRQVYNTFDRLKKRITGDGQTIRNFPVKVLRKTGGDLIRKFSDGETASIFLIHGKTVKNDALAEVYTNRPFGKVYRAIQRVEDYLTPVFAEAPSDPTKAQPQAYTKRSEIDTIRQMKRDGKSVREISEAVGKSKSTVHRLLNRIEE